MTANQLTPLPPLRALPVAANEPLDSITYFDLLQSVWQRKALLLLGVVIALSLGALYYAQATPSYESSAEVLVVRKRPEVVTGDQIYARPTDDYLSTHAVLIKSPVIVERAIVAHDLDKLTTFTNPRYRDLKVDLTTSVMDRLSVKLGSKAAGRDATNILTVSFRGPVPEECSVAVKAILDSYQAFLEETYRNMGEDTIKLIGHARDDLQKDLSAQEEAYRDFRRTSPLVSNGVNEVNPRHARLTAIEQQLSEILLREASFESQLANIKHAKESGRTPEEMVGLVTNLVGQTQSRNGRPQSTLGLDGELFALIQEQQQMRQNYGPNHPHVKSVEDRIKATQSFFALPNASYQNTGMQKAGKLNDPVTLYESYLEQELAGVRISRQLLSDLYARQHESAKELTSFELRDEGFQQSIRRTRQLYDGVVLQLQGAGLVKDYDGFDARVIAAPMIGERISPKLLVVFPAAFILGSFLGCMLVFAAESTDRRFRSPEEIRMELGCPIVGTAPEFLPVPKAECRDESVDGMMYAFHKPASTITEIYRGVRTALYFSTHGKAHKIIQVTSAGPGDGKSTLASNLAICIAQSGKSVLLMDGDLRRPRAHKLFGVSNDVGLASVIGLDVDIADAVSDTPVQNLYLMPSGPLPPDPSELLSSHRFQELLMSVRETYEYVVIDTGPLLAITDPSVVASTVDGVVLAIRITKNSRSHAKQARELLAGLGANLLGVFVNGVASKNSGYGYDGAYTYSYSYKTHEIGSPQQAVSGSPR